MLPLSREIVVADEILDGTDVIGQFLGERQRFADQTGHALPQRVIEAFDVIGFPGLLRDGFVPLRRNHTCIGVILIRMERGLLTVRPTGSWPTALWHCPTAIPHVKGNDLAGLASMAIQIHCLLAFFRTKLHISSASASSCRMHHVGWTDWELDM